MAAPASLTPAPRPLGAFPPTREEDDLFGTSSAPDPILPTDPSPAKPDFRNLSGFSLPKSHLFDDGDDLVSPVPGSMAGTASASHASLFPYEKNPSGALGRTEDGSLAASLFREKAIKDSALAASPAPDGERTEQPKRDCAERVILDGDGRPLPPMLKGEEEEFAKAFFELERKQSESRFLTKLKKKLVRMLVAVCVLGVAGTVAMLVVPKETLAVWKTGVAEWLEPGMAVLDFLPEGVRPDWPPRSDYGIDAVDENGNPVKLNAMEGLEKLKGDIGNMRGAAEAGLKELENY